MFTVLTSSQNHCKRLRVHFVHIIIILIIILIIIIIYSSPSRR